MNKYKESYDKVKITSTHTRRFTNYDVNEKK